MYVYSLDQTLCRYQVSMSFVIELHEFNKKEKKNMDKM